MNVHGTFAILGEEGSGKSIISVSKAYEYLVMGLPVISNFDLFLHNLLPLSSRATYIRVPDFPTAEQLWQAVGFHPEQSKSYDSESESAEYSEKKFGLVLLDEIAVSANAREWKDDKRKALIDFFRQTRKRGYDKFFLSQGINSIDSQIRNDLIKFEVNCRRTDSIRIPFIGGLLQMIGLNAMLPNAHIATVISRNSKLVAERWWTSGKRWYNAYNTKQTFTNENKLLTGHDFRYVNTPHGLIKIQGFYKKHLQEVLGIYTVLSAWHTHGRYQTFADKHRYKFVYLAIFLTISIFIFQVLIPAAKHFFEYQHQKAIQNQITKILPIEYDITGLIQNGSFIYITTKKGSFYADQYTQNGIIYYRVGDILHSIPSSTSDSKKHLGTAQ